MHNKNHLDLRFVNNGYAYQPETKTLLAALSGTYTTARKKAIDQMIKSLKTAGIWSKLDVFQMYAAPTAADAVVNWKSPGTFNATLVNSPTLEVDRGITGDGASSYIRSGLNPTTASINYTLNDRSIGAYLRNDVADAISFGGIAGTGYSITLIPRTATGVISTRLNTSGTRGTVATVATSAGITILEGNVSTEYYTQKDKAVRATLTITSSGIPNLELYVTAQNSNGSPASYSALQVSCFFVGAYLGQTLCNTLVDTIETYLDYIGAGVIA